MNSGILQSCLSFQAQYKLFHIRINYLIYFAKYQSVKSSALGKLSFHLLMRTFRGLQEFISPLIRQKKSRFIRFILLHLVFKVKENSRNPPKIVCFVDENSIPPRLQPSRGKRVTVRFEKSEFHFSMSCTTLQS